MQSVNSQEKQININGLNINYKTIGNGNISIVFLHGWGIDSNKYAETAEHLLQEAKAYNLQVKIIIPDLPGFGKSEEPEEDWSLDDYVEFVDKFVETATRKSGFELVKNILKNFNLNSLAVGGLTSNKEIGPPNKFILIGHSFGGRIAIKYAIKYPEKVEKLILTGAAGIKHPLNRKQKIFYVLAKIGKKIFFVLKEAKLPIGSLASASQKFLYKAAREKDYFSASSRMKEIMKNVTAEDLTPIFDQIKAPTLLIWGKGDHSTPLSDGKIMNEKIKDSELIVIKGANHSLPYQKPKEFAKIVTDFIQKNR